MMIFQLENIINSGIRFAKSQLLEQVLGKSTSAAFSALFIFHPNSEV